MKTIEQTMQEWNPENNPWTTSKIVAMVKAYTSTLLDEVCDIAEPEMINSPGETDVIKVGVNRASIYNCKRLVK